MTVEGRPTFSKTAFRTIHPIIKDYFSKIILSGKIKFTIFDGRRHALSISSIRFYFRHEQGRVRFSTIVSRGQLLSDHVLYTRQIIIDSFLLRSRAVDDVTCLQIAKHGASLGGSASLPLQGKKKTFLIPPQVLHQNCIETASGSREKKMQLYSSSGSNGSGFRDARLQHSRPSLLDAFGISASSTTLEPTIILYVDSARLLSVLFTLVRGAEEETPSYNFTGKGSTKGCTIQRHRSACLGRSKLMIRSKQSQDNLIYSGCLEDLLDVVSLHIKGWQEEPFFCLEEELKSTAINSFRLSRLFKKYSSSLFCSKVLPYQLLPYSLCYKTAPWPKQQRS